MTYEEWRVQSKDILKQADDFNKWQIKVKNNLLENIGPRIAKLGKTGYYGCGFHYGMEQRFGKLIVSLSLPWQPCANHLDKISDDITNNIITEVLYDGLLEDVEEAEKTVDKR